MMEGKQELQMTSKSDANKPNLKHLFKRFEDNIIIVSRQIQDGERRAADHESSFDRQKYWESVDAVFKMLSTETTKISLAYSKTPFPSEKNTETMISELEKRILTLVSLYYSLPTSEGNLLLSEYKKAVLQGLDCLQGFTNAVSLCIDTNSHAGRMQWTGGVWEASNFVLHKGRAVSWVVGYLLDRSKFYVRHLVMDFGDPSELTLKDNKQCALYCLAGTAELVNDAIGEINEARETDGCTGDLSMLSLEQDGAEEEATQWSDQDRMVVDSCEGLVKTTKAMLKKAKETIIKRANVDSVEAVSTLDDFIGLTSNISRTVDDFICCIYAPVNYAALKRHASGLADLTRQCLQFLRGSALTSDQDLTWLDFLTEAVSHNLLKLEDRTKPNIDRG